MDQVVVNHPYSMASSPRGNLNIYLNDLDTYQRKYKLKDATDRIKVPYQDRIRIPQSKKV
jgi:hypothetical protein